MQCYNQITLIRDDDTLTVPCGKCYECLQRRISGWVFRLGQHEKASFSSHFVTLTYNSTFLPFSPSGYPTLKKADLQNYLKRLRKLNTNLAKISYMAAGEYGDKNERPHYHLIIFNSTAHDIINAWALGGQAIGDVYLGDVQPASIAYCFKYLQKPRKTKNTDKDDRQREKTYFSKGLGISYLSSKNVDYHFHNGKVLEDRYYIPIEDGKKIGIPRYYKEKLFWKHERDILSDYAQFMAYQEEQRRKFLEGDLYYHNQQQRKMYAVERIKEIAKKNSLNSVL